MKPFYYVVTEFNDTVNGRMRETHATKTSAILHFERTCSRCKAAVAIVEVKGPVYGGSRETIAIRGRTEMTIVKHFTESDIEDGHGHARIYADRDELIYCPPEWMKAGLRETSSGYGSRLNSGYKISFNGRLYRIYVTIFSNAGTTWFSVRGRKIIVS